MVRSEGVDVVDQTTFLDGPSLGNANPKLVRAYPWFSVWDGPFKIGPQFWSPASFDFQWKPSFGFNLAHLQDNFIE